MAEDSRRRRSVLESVKAPLIFSAALAIVASLVTLVASAGGSGNERVDTSTAGFDNPLNLALLAFGVVFIVSLLVVSMLQLASRENPDHLSAGSGVNQKAEEVYKEQVAKRRRAQRDEQRRERENNEGEPNSDSSPHAEDGSGSADDSETEDGPERS